MNILVLSREFPPHLLGGISYHLKNLYNEVVENGHNITVLAGTCPQSYDDFDGNISEKITVEPVEFGYRKGYYVLYPLALRKKLPSINLIKFDIAVAHTPLPFEIPNLPLVTKYHDCVAETRQHMRPKMSKFDKIGDSILHPLRRIIDQRSLQITDYAIFNSQVNKEGWTSNYEFDGSYSVIFNGVDTDLFKPVEAQTQEYVVFVGTTEQKGLGEVTNYADKYRRPVHIVGSIQLDHPNIICHGRVSQTKLRDIYVKATATIHPAKFESFGNTVLESLACGTPVVTTSQCGASGVLTDETGVVTTDLDSGIEEVADFEPDVCRQVAEDYKWGHVARRTEEILETVTAT